MKNKNGGTSAGTITIQAEKYFPTSGAIPMADSATATTLRDAALATAALGDDYFNGCWVFIVDGTGTDNGFVLITDYDDGNGDVVVSSWTTQPDNTSRYIIVGALIDGEGSRARGFELANNIVPIYFYGIGIDDCTVHGLRSTSFSYLETHYTGIYGSGFPGLLVQYGQFLLAKDSGFVNNNTNNNADSSGISSRAMQFSYVLSCGLSDNNQQGILGYYGGMLRAEGNFGDGNGAWGVYVKYSTQARIIGTECSGGTGNHSDEGTAGANADDQAAAYT